MKRSWMRMYWVSCFLTLLTAICSAAEKTIVVDAGAYVIPTGFVSNIYWLDNRSVVFIGTQEANANPAQQGMRLLQFDVGHRHLNDLGQIGGGLCAYDGKLRYWRPRANLSNALSSPPTAEWLEGPVGKVIVSPEPKISPNGDRIDPLQACRFEPEIPPLPDQLEVLRKSTGSLFVRLKPEHGWVEFAKRSGDPPHVLRQYPAAIIPPGGQAEGGIALPEFFREYLKRITRYNGSLQYYPHRNAYVLRTAHHQSPLPEGVRTTLWWIYPDGRVEEIVSYTRDKSWPLANENSFIPARSGIYFIGADPTLTSYVGLYGLFRYFDDNKRRRVVAGRIGPAVLSPDGCKLAFGNDDRRRVEGARQYKLQVVDLCKGEKK